METRTLVRAHQRPLRVILHTPHEEIRHPHCIEQVSGSLHAGWGGGGGGGGEIDIGIYMYLHTGAPYENICIRAAYINIIG